MSEEPETPETQPEAAVDASGEGSETAESPQAVGEATEPAPIALSGGAPEPATVEAPVPEPPPVPELLAPAPPPIPEPAPIPEAPPEPPLPPEPPAAPEPPPPPPAAALSPASHPVSGAGAGDRPELVIGAAFAGGFALAMVLKRLVG